MAQISFEELIDILSRQDKIAGQDVPAREALYISFPPNAKKRLRAVSYETPSKTLVIDLAEDETVLGIELV